MAHKKPLSESFQATSYSVISSPDENILTLIIEGVRLGRPSKRISFHQKNLRVTSAHILSSHKNKTIEYDIQRINHLPKLQEVRLHTAQNLYPGPYKITLGFRGDSEHLKNIFSLDLEGVEIRPHLPCIDEPQSKKNAVFKIR